MRTVKRVLESVPIALVGGRTLKRSRQTPQASWHVISFSFVFESRSVTREMRVFPQSQLMEMGNLLYCSQGPKASRCFKKWAKQNFKCRYTPAALKPGHVALCSYPNIEYRYSSKFLFSSSCPPNLSFFGSVIADLVVLLAIEDAKDSQEQVNDVKVERDRRCNLLLDVVMAHDQLSVHQNVSTEY